jgi:hypothetical protein
MPALVFFHLRNAMKNYLCKLAKLLSIENQENIALETVKKWAEGESLSKR